jgi:multidrug resistance efflux pump
MSDVTDSIRMVEDARKAVERAKRDLATARKNLEDAQRTLAEANVAAISGSADESARAADRQGAKPTTPDRSRGEDSAGGE